MHANVENCIQLVPVNLTYSHPLPLPLIPSVSSSVSLSTEEANSGTTWMPIPQTVFAQSVFHSQPEELSNFVMHE
jgi:hypothetical protein